MEFELKKEQKECVCKMYKLAGKRARKARLPQLRFEESTLFLNVDVLKKIFMAGFLAVSIKSDQKPTSGTWRTRFLNKRPRKESELFLHCYAFEANVPIKLRECEKGIEVEDVVGLDGKVIRNEMYLYLLSYSENPKLCSGVDEVGMPARFETWHEILEMDDYLIFGSPIVTARHIRRQTGNLDPTVHSHPFSPKESMSSSFIMRLLRLAPRPVPVAFSDGDLSCLLNYETLYYEGTIGVFSLDVGVFMEKAREKIKELGDDAFHKEGDKRGFLKFEYVKEIAKDSANACANEKYLGALYEKKGMPFVLARYEQEGGAIAVYTKLKVT